MRLEARPSAPSTPKAARPADGETYSLGVDLGTTFVAAAISRGSHPEMVTLGNVRC